MLQVLVVLSFLPSVYLHFPRYMTILPNLDICGLTKPGLDDRIFGGDDTSMGEFPWMVLINYKNKKNNETVGFRCGGTLINNRYAMTAAHCLTSSDLYAYEVRLGEWRLSTNPDCINSTGVELCADNVMDIPVEEIVPHPAFHHLRGDHDIGLVRLSSHVDYTEFIKPVCILYPEFPPAKIGTMMTVVGWGATELEDSSDVKKHIEIPLVNNSECNIHFKRTNNTRNQVVGPNRMCAGGVDERDACQGDSGGPLMSMRMNKFHKMQQWFQEGIVSRGLGCGNTGIPGVYTKVSKYYIWLLNNMYF